MIKKIGVVGAGTMGSGIALAAALGGFDVILCDIKPDVLEEAKKHIAKNGHFLLGKQKITEEEYDKLIHKIIFSSAVHECIADIVIEAIVENAGIKEKLFLQLAAVNPAKTIFASNTSSLSVSFVQKNIPGPQRVAGMHFFNPAHVMKLVEVIKGSQTDDDVVQTLMEVCSQMGKIPVLCKDSPGFIVNRVARHYYLQAMELVQNNVATIENVDAAMEAVGFKMGPFKLMDLIGMDINFAVSASLYGAFDQAERFRPQAMQIDKVEKGELGQKTGKGFYTYSKD
jgi:3-hydroxybutyryl-CoA dehydrogenase